MLIAHAGSSCDICLEPYGWENANTTPHVIACGHVFCLQCLGNVRQNNCPLCRRAYDRDLIQKLHVDPPPETADDLQVNKYLRQLALVSAESAAERDVRQAISEVNGWLALRSELERTSAAHRTLRIAVTALYRNLAVQQEVAANRDVIRQHEEEFARILQVKETDLRTAHYVEQNLLDQLRTTEDGYQEKLARAEKARAEMEVEYIRMRAEHAQFREELAKYKANPSVIPAHQATSERMTYIYPPPATSYTPFSGFSNTANIAYPASGRNDTLYLRSDPSRPTEMSQNIPAAIVKEEPAPRSKKTTRPPIMIPGASASKKVIPPRNNVQIVSPPTQYYEERRRSIYAAADVPPLSSRDHDTPQAHATDESRSVYAQSIVYGSASSIGAASRTVSPPEIQSMAHIRPESAVGQLMLYSQESQATDLNTGPSVEAAARALAVSSGEIETNETTWGHVHNALVLRSNASSSSLATTVATSDPATNARASATTSASGSRNDLALVSAPGRSAGTSAPVIPGRDAASTRRHSLDLSMGAVPTARSSRSSGLGDLQLTNLPAALASMDSVSQFAPSRHSSMSDLRLARLPDLSDTYAVSLDDTDESDRDDPSSDTPRVSSGRALTLWPGAAHTAAPSAQGPPQSSAPAGTHVQPSRARPSNGSGETSRAPDPAPALAGLGLALSGPSQHQVSGQEDLHHVNRTLLQHAAAPRSQRARGSRRMSLSDSEDLAEVRSRSWESRPQRVDTSRSMDDRSAARRADPAAAARPSGGPPSASHTHADRDLGPQQRGGRSQSRGQDTSDTPRRRHSQMTTAPPIASSLSFHSERNVPHPTIAIELSPRPRSTSLDFGSFSRPAHTGILDGGSLLLSFAPSGPTTSAATTATGEPSSIRAPRPINGGHTQNIVASWNSQHHH